MALSVYAEKRLKLPVNNDGFHVGVVEDVCDVVWFETVVDRYGGITVSNSFGKSNSKFIELWGKN